MNSTILSVVMMYSSMFQVDPYLVQSIIMYESSGIPTKVGQVGEVGLMQIRPEYAMGVDKDLLFDVRVNIITGIMMLKQAKKECVHKAFSSYILCYNMGIAGAKKIKHPFKAKYYRGVMNEYKKLRGK